MFTVNNNPILQSEISVIEELRRQCILKGINIFKDIKESGNDIMVTCPFHKGGQERKPSFGISKKDMKCHCFTCGYSGNLNTMISKIFGYEGEETGKQWLTQNFVSVEIETRKKLNLNFDRTIKINKNANTFVTEEELEKYRYTHPYMYERGLTDEIINRFDIGYDIHTDCITFPVLDINKSCVFVARRSVHTKYFNYPSNVEKPVYLAYAVKELPQTDVIICESFLNALTCWKYNKPAVALLGTGTQKQYKILNELPVRKYIVATDPDEAGEKAYLKLRKNLSRSKILTRYVLPKGKDMNDLDSDILKLVEIF